ncbi:tRNA-uridine aminocarboxypropyltransferase [Shewanella psychrotolerans]|uniref:tRNA-uridine aminocarboxypropyltransferase n=1 Tax=Shewanella psychrotolerans TaxID=2864206 RepID=UPI001C65D3F2|nr:DTW domain-containing protein [Shewanella psychrotolerans]QYJ99773.1 DTW domain-containing protein [Shewanella psychrotolerans]
MTQLGIKPHAVHLRYQYRKAISTRPYNARGKNLIRCESCLLAKSFCTCEFRRQLNSNVSFLLIMYDDEVLKPSNSGRLIADLIPDTHAYIWSRNYANRKLLQLLSDPSYQPYLVFPGAYAAPDQQVVDAISQQSANEQQSKRPLFILLDGSWREAIKMFNKSPYLHHLPMLSFTPETAARYGLRKGSRDFQLGTAEVAALALGCAGEVNNAASLNMWFSLFIESSLFSRSRKSTHDLSPLTALRQAFEQSLEPSQN